MLMLPVLYIVLYCCFICSAHTPSCGCGLLLLVMQVSDRGQQKKVLEFEEVLDASTMSEVVRNCTALVYYMVRGSEPWNPGVRLAYVKER